MTLTEVERKFLDRQQRGHLSTIGPDGAPQVKPLGFSYNEALGTIDITGFNMGGSAKYRNIQLNPRVAFVVDEVTEPTMEGSHFLEIRGIAEAATGTPDGHLAAEIIRIYPQRVLAWNVDPDTPGLQARDLSTDASPLPAGSAD
jgi:pyridoxamine 5'-phosphate oxidase family protein